MNTQKAGLGILIGLYWIIKIIACLFSGITGLMALVGIYGIFNPQDSDPFVLDLGLLAVGVVGTAIGMWLIGLMEKKIQKLRNRLSIQC